MQQRFINPTPAAEAKLLGEKVARNAAFREVRVQAIKRRLDEGEALGSRAAAGRGKAEGEGIRDNVHDGRMAGSFTVAGLEAVAAAGTGGADEQRGRGERVGVGGRGTEPSDDSSSRDGRLRENNLTIAPSHPEDSQRGGSGGGDTHGSGSGQRQRQRQERGQRGEQWWRLREPERRQWWQHWRHQQQRQQSGSWQQGEEEEQGRGGCGCDRE